MANGFTFKQFHVDDLDCGMPVSTDGVLLGAWAPLFAHGTILDIGTGSGLLALMSAQRSVESRNPIIALDIDVSAVKAATHNAKQSPWTDRLRIHHADLQHWQHQQAPHSIDTIICNPPYFNFGQQANCDKRATARHTDTLSHHNLIESVKHLLTPYGIASFILPEYEGRLFITAAKTHGLYCQRLCEIRTTERKPINRLLFSLTPNECDTEHQQLNIHQQGQYSDAFIELTQSFYLKM
ncbi:tRNA1(Val) (adenine(37)-N6)-methyltransferase [Photobacterium sanguinicancri]|uniref:tRNA1(Val) (adenine(37)-N6)-methyltransferase n=1 Tax=Photobacterium sanguinicancri TaxID=875932 RepID=UPI003D0A45E6